MKGFPGLCLLICGGMTSIPALSQTAADTQKIGAQAHASKATIEGLVRDIACPLQNLEATATHLNMKCLRACARKDSPLVILSNEGESYLSISEKMPDVVHVFWVYVVRSCLILGALSAGLFVISCTIVFCVPLMIQHGSDIGSGLKVPVDALLPSGALCLAGSQCQAMSDPRPQLSHLVLKPILWHEW